MDEGSFKRVALDGRGARAVPSGEGRAGGAKYRAARVGPAMRQTREEGAMKARLDAGSLRKETRDWITTHTLRDARAIASDLQNAGEDVGGLLKAIEDLEGLVGGGSTKGRRRSRQ